ncbi:MAG: hypothetical protein ACOC3V_02755 [bacterium]
MNWIINECVRMLENNDIPFKGIISKLSYEEFISLLKSYKEAYL